MQTTSGNQDWASVAWLPAANAFALAWDDSRNSGQYQIYANTLTTGGSLGAEHNIITAPSSAWARVPSLAAAGDGGFVGMAYTDMRNTYSEVCFVRLDKYAIKIGAEARIIPETSNNAYNPRMAWTGAEFGIVFEDFRGGTRDGWFQTVTVNGAANGSPRQVVFNAGSNDPALAFARYGYMVTAHGGYGNNLLQPVGCTNAYNPPCPENAVAYNVSGNQATLSWLPALDPYTDLAYYQVYRNNALVGITDDAVYTDTGLALGTIYNYAIRAVNAGKMVSYGCPATSSVYVKTGASLLLMVNKSPSGTDAGLSWTDAGMAGYNVFRGISPQVMSLIGTTTNLSADDPGVLSDDVLYFYTVDDPGQ